LTPSESYIIFIFFVADNVDSDEALDEPEDVSEDEFPLPEHIPSLNKRRLFSRSSSEDEAHADKPAKKKKKGSSLVPYTMISSQI